jgi:REP element-mobilizing transposase RayT
MLVNEWGRLAKNEWWRLGQRFEQVCIDESNIMPNHIHGILCIVGAGQEYPMLPGESPLAPPLRKNTSFELAPGSLGAIIGAFKSTTARLINGLRRPPGAPVWQRNYYEHILRDEIELRKVQIYLIQNPLKWEMDQENPVGISM